MGIDKADGMLYYYNSSETYFSTLSVRYVIHYEMPWVSVFIFILLSIEIYHF